MKKKNFSILVVDLSTSSQSIGGRIIPLARYFVQHKHKVVLLVNKAAKRTSLSLSGVGRGSLVRFFPFSKHFPATRFMIGLEYLKRIIISPFVKINREVDVVYSLTGIICDVIPSFIIAKKKGALWVVNVDNVEAPPSKKPGSYLVNLFALLAFRISLFFLQFADLVFITTPLDEIKKTLIKGGVKPNKIILSNNGIPLDLIRKTGMGRKKKYGASFIGRINERKGVFDLVKAWRMVLNKIPKAGKLLIIGWGDAGTIKKLRGLIKKEKLVDLIILAGFVSNEKQKYSLLKRSAIFLFPSHYEANPIVTVEALACRLPVVAYNLPIFVKHYPRGLLTIASRGDVIDFSKKTIAILGDNKKIEELGKKGYSFAKKFNWEEIFNKQEKAILGLLTKK